MARFWFGLGRRADFYADMAAFLGAGKTPNEIMSEMLVIAQKRKRLRNLAIILKDALKGLEGGKSSLGVALAPWVPAVEASMIVSGEQSGTLEGSFKELAWNVGEQARIKEAAMAKGLPIASLILAAIALMIYVITMVVPQASKMITPAIAAELLIAPHYIAGGQWVIEWMVPIGIALVAAVIGATMSLSRWTGKQRIRADRIALPWSVYSWTQASFFLSSAAAMLKSGTTFRDALKEMQRNASPWQRWHMRRMLSSLQAGAPEVRAMDTGMLPEPVMDRLLMYASLPSFPDAMQRLAKDSIKMYEKTINALASRIQIGVMIGLAVFILLTFASLGEVSLAVEDAANAARNNSGI